MMIVDLVKRLITFVKIKSNHLSCVLGASYIGLDVKIVNRGQIVFGENVIIRPSTGLYTNPGIMLSIGSNTEIGNHSTIAAHHKVIIENGVLTGPHVFIADYNHEYRDVDKPVWEQGEFAQENSYYVCNCEPTGVLIDTLRSIDFFALRDAMNLSASLREPSHISMR